MNSLPELTPTQRENIDYLITSVGSMSRMGLVFNSAALWAASGCLDEAHPLRLLEHIGSTPDLRAAVKDISEFRWSVILDGRYGVTGLVERCEAAHAEGSLSQTHLAELFTTLNVAMHQFSSLLQEHAWGELVTQLCAQL